MNIFEENRNIQEQNYENTNDGLFINRLIQKGYFPENNILPYCFQSSIREQGTNFFYHPVVNNKIKNLSISEPITISTPKGVFYERVFGIINPRIYYDISKILIGNKKGFQKRLFNKNNKIFSYGFPFPPKISVNVHDQGNITYSFQKRSGEFIKSYLEAENSLLIESVKYKYFLKTDIKNFYPSIYTHSIPRALHTKAKSRKNIGKYRFIGNKIDVLLQKGNDNCTNGIVVGPILSDFIGEILLNTIDVDLSNKLKKMKIDFLGIRFKDDYKILFKSEEDAKKFLIELRKCLGSYNLYLHEDKTQISNNLPEIIFRPRIIEVDSLYNQYIKEYWDSGRLIKKDKIGIKKIKEIYLKLLSIDDQYPNHGIFEKMLSKLVYKFYDRHGYNTCFLLENSDINIFTSLLLQLKNRRLQCLPMILGILELIIPKDDNHVIYNSLLDLLNNSNNEYEILRLLYFFRKQNTRRHNDFKNKYKSHKNQFISSIAKNEQDFYINEGITLFNNQYQTHGFLLDNVNLFGYEQLI